MTPNEINISMAESLGFTVRYNESKGLYELISPSGKWEHPYDADGHTEDHCWQYVPDYYNDLNACAEAEDAIITTPGLEQEYYFNINRNYRAKAQERCEGLLRTLGKWKE